MANPTHQFIIQPIIPLEIGGFDISITNSTVWMVLAVVCSFLIFGLGSQSKSLVPGKLQTVAEMGYEFIASMIKDNIGPDGRQYFPFIFCLFFYILMGNVLGLIPGSFTFTSHIIVTATLALFVFFSVVIFGFMKNGKDFLSLFMPPGLPPPLLVIIIPLEIISFTIRPVTLSMRLFANMMAGHMVLKVFAGFSTMMLGIGALGYLGAVAPVLLNVAVYALELLVACLHAYIFAVLSCTYLKDTVDLHH